MTKREKYPTRSILLVGDMQKETAKLLIDHAPTDRINPVEFVLREPVKARKQSQNDLMWSGPMADIAEQAYVEGRTYSAEVWHEYFKEQYLPEEYDAELCKEGYKKWAMRPDGKRVLVGSTTQLTIKGFAQYLTQIEAYGASLGVMFRVRERKAA
jgi:hypothetical protein